MKDVPSQDINCSFSLDEIVTKLRVSMVSFNLSHLTGILSVFALVGNAVCIHLRAHNFSWLDSKARVILERATPAAPHFVIYSDKGTNSTGPPPPAQVKVRYTLSHLNYVDSIFEVASKYPRLSDSLPGLT